MHLFPSSLGTKNSNNKNKQIRRINKNPSEWKHLDVIEARGGYWNGEKIVPKFLKKLNPYPVTLSFLTIELAMAHSPNEWVQYTFKLSLSLSFCVNGPWALSFVYMIFQLRPFKKNSRDFPVQKWVQCSFIMLFTRNVKKIKGAAHRSS